ncbi:MAG TPA: hypothetical protein VGQ36_22480 [Thermoanaerobaculia bacterium]|jgi:hypothetical protein|nr:hypothetical protein [Thermoanaerobaculia bacterium]
MIWREKRVLLLVLGALLLGNVIFFLTYRVQYQARLDALDDRLAQAEGQLAKSRQGRADAERQLQAYKKVEAEVSNVFDEHWSTQPRRLTLLIAEIKRLADASNAIPRSYSFSTGEARLTATPGTRGKAGAVVGTKEVGIAYTVEASYDQARRMINLLELSQQFVIIDEISLSSGAENKLNLNLRLKTIFRDEPLAAATNRL